ncbi:MAG: HEAT repeat domain-containing protein [Sandaracinaceae bacterium]|nr:HEAT repeat domain-containing protein [Sandaracinaceae bacterium]
MQENDDFEELSDLPESPPASAFDAAPDLGPPLGDDEAVRKMGSGTPIWAWGLFVVLLAALGGVGFVWFQQNQAYEQRWDAYRQAQSEAADEQDFLRRIRGMLATTSYEDVKIRILQKMAQYRDAESTPVITQQLSSEVATVRAAAARALAAIGSPGADSAKAELMRILPRTDARDRAPIVWALAVLGESAAADAIIAEFSSGRLQGQEGFDPRVISNVLGPTRLSSNDLLNHSEVSVRALTAAALAEMASADVIDPLSRMTDFELARPEPDENVLRSIASGLGRAGDARAGTPLFRILETQPAMGTVVLDSLRKTVGAPGIAALLPSARDPRVRLELVRMLASSHDPRAADPLAELVGSEDAEISQEASFGLAELGDGRAVPGLLRLARGLDLQVGREALSKIQLLGVPEAADGLVEMLADEQFLGRRANILRALGTTGAAHVGAVLQRNLAGDDIGSAAMALADLDYDPAYDVLLRMIPRPRDTDFSTPTVANEMAYMNRTAAVRALGRYRRPQAAQALMTIVEDPLDDRRLRQNAGLALGALANEETLRSIVARIRAPELDEFAKRYYVSALWQNPSREIAADLMGLVTAADTPPDVRRAASLAIGYAADPGLDARIRELLDNPEQQREAAFMIVLGGSDANGRALLAAMAGNAELQQTLLFQLRDDQTNAFNLVTQSGFASGAVWRRLSVASILNEGEGDNRHGYIWNHIVQRLRAGWDGHDGVTPRQVREHLWTALRGDDPARRRLAASVLAAMVERGLLMAARDQGGNGAEEARAMLQSINNPQQPGQARAQ